MTLSDALKTTEAAIRELYAKATAGGDVDALAGDLAAGEAKARLLRTRLDAEQAKAATRAAAEAERIQRAEREQAAKVLEARRADLETRWHTWGGQMAAIANELPSLWTKYRSLAADAMVLAADAAKFGVQLAPVDPGTAANDVMRDIVTGFSPYLKDARR